MGNLELKPHHWCSVSYTETSSFKLAECVRSQWGRLQLSGRPHERPYMNWFTAHSWLRKVQCCDVSFPQLYLQIQHHLNSSISLYDDRKVLNFKRGGRDRVVNSILEGKNQWGGNYSTSRFTINLHQPRRFGYCGFHAPPSHIRWCSNVRRWDHLRGVKHLWMDLC